MYSVIFSRLYYFIKRDWYLLRRDLLTCFIDDCLLKVVIFAISFGYIMPRIGGLSDSLDIFLGSILWVVLPLPSHQTMSLMFDLSGERFISYQITFVKPWLLISQRVFTLATFCFIVLLLFYPIGLTLLGYSSLLYSMDWIGFILLLYIAALYSCIYMIFFMIFLSGPDKVANFWLRINLPLMILGGSLVPRLVMVKFFGMFGWILYLNPFIYISEGIKRTILHEERFLSVLICIPVLIVFTVFLIAISSYYLRRRIDSV